VNNSVERKQFTRSISLPFCPPQSQRMMSAAAGSGSGQPQQMGSPGIKYFPGSQTLE
jgi:hypothetical protein